MALPLEGPFAFNDMTIDAKVTLQIPGVYLLGYKLNNVFQVQRVGRSDDNLNSRLKSSEYRGLFREFKACYCSSDEEAFHSECELWHAYGGTLNPNHPAMPKGKFIVCRLCPRR
jgi:hypothetical protein